MGDRKPRAPAGLGATGKRLWRSVTGELELRGDERGLLEHACRTVDELATLQAALAEAEPMSAGSMGQPRAHPLYAEIRAHRDMLRRLLAAIDVPDEGDVGEAVRPMSNVSASARRRWEEYRRDQAKARGGA